MGLSASGPRVAVAFSEVGKSGVSVMTQKWIENREGRGIVRRFRNKSIVVNEVKPHHEAPQPNRIDRRRRHSFVRWSGRKKWSVVSVPHI